MKYTNWTVCVALLLICSCAHSQFDDGPPPTSKPAVDPVKIDADKAFKDNQARYAGNPNFLVRPGLLADRAAKHITIWARFCDVKKSDPIEFFVVPEDSQKDYEALITSYAAPADVRDALQFIGMTPGRPADPGHNEFWPRGERVIANMTWTPPGAAPKTVRAEDFLLDTRNGKVIPHDGFVFTGSHMLPSVDGAPPQLAATVLDSRCVLSDYNEGAAILDVPRRAPQNEVYGFQKINPDCPFTPMSAVSITLDPEYKDGTTRVRDYELKVSMGPDDKYRFNLTDKDDKSLLDPPDITHLLAQFQKFQEDKTDAFVIISIDKQMTIAQAAKVFALLGAADNQDGIRIGPPHAGQLYYQAFFPKELWRDRTHRLGQPWEVHLETKDQKTQATLILPPDDPNTPEKKLETRDPNEAVHFLDANSDRFSMSLFVFLPPTMTYGQMMDFITPAMATHREVYVFPEK